MQRIVLASHNPVKIRATLEGFRRVFPGERFHVESASFPSGVRRQPLSDEETLQGARNRAQGAARLRPEADFWAGIEGGVAELQGEMLSFSWVYILSHSLAGMSRSATFLLPPQVAAQVRAGQELGTASDLLFEQVDSGRSAGAVGLLTGGGIDRAQLYTPAVVLALIPFRNLPLFSDSSRSPALAR